MRRRLFPIALFLALSAAALLSAKDFSLKGSRIGLEFGNPAGVIIYRPGSFDFKLGYNFVSGNQFVFLSGDYRIISGYQLVDFLHFFLGAGAYTQVYLESRDDGQFNLGARLPFGLQAFLFDTTLEVFLELVPTINFFPSITAFQDFQGWLGFTILLK